ncbi:MAG: TerB family tellurite resistance protein [Candidatus Eremiobacterota bacterium]
MFLQQLNEREKKHFLYLAQKLIKIDNKIKVVEVSLLKKLTEEMGLSMHDAVKVEDINKAWQIFTARESRIILLVELISIGYVDDDFCASENELIKEICSAFSISDTKLQLIEQWVIDERDLSASIKNLLSKEEMSQEEKKELEKLTITYEELIQKVYEV